MVICALQSARGSKGDNSPSEIAPLHQFNSSKIKSSEPIPIGSCHTVSGHEAMDLAKRLSKELASQQQIQGGSLGATRSMSPDTEPRSRSYETTQSKPKGKVFCRFFFSKYCYLFLYVAMTRDLTPSSSVKVLLLYFLNNENNHFSSL